MWMPEKLFSEIIPELFSTNKSFFILCGFFFPFWQWVTRSSPVTFDLTVEMHHPELWMFPFGPIAVFSFWS